MFAKIFQGGRALAALTLLGIAVSAALAPRADAAAYNYGTRTRTINAGVLVVDDVSSNNYDGNGATATADDPDPYVFYVLSQRPDVEPNGWNIVNPLAPHTVTGDILDRWDNRTSNNVAYQLNQPVTPNMAAYWEVMLSKTTLTSLEQFDVLLLDVQNHTVSLTDNEIQELRRYVDNGGQLWIEDSGGGSFQFSDQQASSPGPYYGPLFFEADFNNGASAGDFVLPSTNGLLLHHPILAAPYLLTTAEISALGNAYATTQSVEGVDSNNQPTATSLPDNSYVTTVLATTGVQSTSGNNQPVISAGQYGAGQIVIEALGAGDAINSAVSGIPNGVSGQTNAGPYCGNNFAAAPAADLKFASDIISWGAAHPNEHKNSHQSSQSENTLGPALSATWNFTPNSTTIPSQTAPIPTPGAAINGNLVYVRTSEGYLRCFNATPGTDILGTGFVDAGEPDYSTKGTSWDEVWGTNGDGFPGTSVLTLQDPAASAPIVASVPISTTGSQTVVFIEGATGIVYAADATTGAPVSFSGSQTAVGQLPDSGPSQNGGASVTYGTAATNDAPAPSPTYYDGRLYAGEPDGTLYVYDFRTEETGRYQAAQPQNGEFAIAPPSVGLVNETINAGAASGGYADDLVISLTTNYATYTLHGGARHDPLGASAAGAYAPAPANTATASTPFMIDTNSGIPPDEEIAYSDYPPGATAPSGYEDILGLLGPTGLASTSNTPSPIPFYGDYDVDFPSPSGVNSGSPAGSLTRAEFFEGVSGASPASSAPTAPVSAAALDNNGNFYYTGGFTSLVGPVDSSIVCVHDVRPSEKDPTGLGESRMAWRFRLPFLGESVVDADGVNYTPLEGYTFVGAPVVDTQGDVFALAAGPNNSVAVLCFNATQPITIQMPVNNSGGAVNLQSVTQPVTAAGADEFGNSPAQKVVSGGGNEFTNQVNFYGRATIHSFGSPPSTGGPMILPNLSEPQSVVATYNINSANNSITQPAIAPLHTNLTWYTVLPLNFGGLPRSIPLGPNGGLTLVGNYLFFGDMNGNIYRLYAYPQSTGNVTNHVYVLTNAADTALAMDAQSRSLIAGQATGAGAINGVPSAGSGVLVVNGAAGVAAFGTKYTLVSDASRVMEVDSEGLVTWLVDATAEANTATGTSTHVELNHPTDVTQITANDYLVADTGNNRCVRFDRSGNVLWELSRFNDTALTDPANNAAITFYTSATGAPATKGAPLLAPGEPTTLSHPTSVTSYVQNMISNGATYTIVHYLIADTGNNRIVEVVDAYKNGQPVGTPHDLVWVSRTYDAEGRPYAYTSANYFTGPDGNSYVAALVTNKRVAQLSPAQSHLTTEPYTQLGSAASDANGSTILLLDYDPQDLQIPSATGQANGYVHVSGTANGWHLSAISTFLGYFNANGTFDLADSPKYTMSSSAGSGPQSATTTPTLLYLRNPRFLQTYTPPGAATNAVQNFLLADDDGVFDLYLDPTGADSGGANTNQYAQNLEATWGFTQADYRNLEYRVVAANGSVAYGPAPIQGLVGTRAGIPFVPNSLVRSTTDTVNVGTTSYLIGHYWVTNGYSVGNVTPVEGFGGEALELQALDGANGLGTYYTSSFGNFGSLSTLLSGAVVPTGSNITSPLSDPTYAGPEK